MKKIGRNDACGCGSGKKYKACCMVKENAQSSSQLDLNQFVEKAIQFHQQGKLSEAKALYEEVLQINPNHAHALHFLGVVAYQHKDYLVAESLMRRAIAMNPTVSMYFCNFGMLLKDQGKYVEAVENHRKALSLQPDYAEASLNLGVALFHLDLLDEAAIHLKKTIQLQPNSAKAHDNLGTVLRSQYDYAGAIQLYQRAFELDGHYVGALANLAATYVEVKNFPMASIYALKAIECDEMNPDAYLYLGIACQEQGDLENAERFFVYASHLAPHSMNTKWNLAITQLAKGNLLQGWQGYEYRWTRETGPVQQHQFPYPWWQGEAMPDKTILVWGEQGIGDEIMFASMISDLIPRFKHCIIACNKKCVALFRRSFPKAQIVAANDQHQLNLLHPEIDVQSAAGSLARWLRPTVASFPKEKSYLSADNHRVQYWKERLASLGDELTVGICWRSSNLAGNRALYCTQLEQWAPIFSVPGVRFINLQCDVRPDEMKLFEEHVEAFSEVDLFNDLVEAAALTQAVDLVISAPTSTAILASALGVPTWMMIAGFEWQKLGTSELCWYSTARVFAREWEMGWECVINEVAHALEKMAQEKLSNRNYGVVMEVL